MIGVDLSGIEARMLTNFYVRTPTKDSPKLCSTGTVHQPVKVCFLRRFLNNPTALRSHYANHREELTQQTRMLTNFCFQFEGGPEFAELVIHGDWHSENAELWWCSRDDAKTELYALHGACKIH